MNTKKIFHGFVGFVAFIVLIFAFSYTQAQTGDNPIGGGVDIDGPSAFGGGTDGGYSYDPNDAPPSDGGPLITGQGSDQYSTPNDRPAYTGYCASSPTAPFKDFSEILKFVTCTILQSIIPLIFAIALAVFLWGMVKFIQAADSAEKEEGKQFMLWGVIALAVMLSVWGLVSILNNTFGIKTVIPQLPVNR